MTELLVLEPEPPGQDIELLLECFVAKARAGELSSIAVAGVRRDGRSFGEWSAIPSVPALIGAVSRLQHRLNLNADGPST